MGPPKHACPVLLRPRKDVPHRCSTHFDAVAQIRGEAFFFKGSPGVPCGGGQRVWPTPAQTPYAAQPSRLSPLSPGKYFWRLTRDRHLVSLQPAQMHRFWRGLPLHLDSVDAVYERTSDHKIVFFKGGRASPSRSGPHGGVQPASRCVEAPRLPRGWAGTGRLCACALSRCTRSTSRVPRPRQPRQARGG
ncbi:Matrix metalloproteinase-17 [Plecturocebus cupreus]